MLDVGCGDGIYTVAVAERGAEVVGVDVSDRMLEAARLRAVERGFEVQLARGSATSLPFNDRHRIVLVENSGRHAFGSEAEAGIDLVTWRTSDSRATTVSSRESNGKGQGNET